MNAPAGEHKILLIEDDEDIRAVMAEVLRDNGYAVVTASNGREGLERLSRNGGIQLILLDLMMPIMSGWEFRRAQLSDSSRAAVPVVVVSGVANTAESARDLQAAGVINKPFSVETLLDEVMKHLSAG